MSAPEKDYLVPGGPNETCDHLTTDGRRAVQAWWRRNTAYDASGSYSAADELANGLPWTESVDGDDLESAIVEIGAVRVADGSSFFRARRAELGVSFDDAEPAPVTYLFDGLVPISSLGMCVGLPGCLKTWFGLGVAKSMLRGEPFAGFNFCGTMSRRTALYIDLEVGSDELRRRSALLGAKGLGKISYPDYGPTTPEFWIAMARLVDDSDAFVVIDSLSRANEGRDEKSSLYADTLSMSARFVEATKATLMWIHHSPKDARGKGLMDLVRGHGAIAGALDYCYHAERIGEIDAVPPRARVTCKKMRRGPSMPDPFVIQVTDARGVERWQEPRGRGGRAKEPDSVTRSDEARVLDALRANADAGRSREELMRATGLSRSRAMVARQALVGAGRVRDIGTHREPHYVLADDVMPSDPSVRPSSERHPADGIGRHESELDI